MKNNLFGWSDNGWNCCLPGDRYKILFIFHAITLLSSINLDFTSRSACFCSLLLVSVPISSALLSQYFVTRFAASTSKLFIS